MKSKYFEVSLSSLTHAYLLNACYEGRTQSLPSDMKENWVKNAEILPYPLSSYSGNKNTHITVMQDVMWWVH